ncbi:MAG: class I SAM-dependent methyltransferase [Acidobacteriota bacterium]
MKADKGNYVPALGFEWLTAVYDPVVRVTTREKLFKAALVRQAGIRQNHCVLGLGCGTGTLAILLKCTQPGADIVGLDGDAKILKIAKRKAQAANTEIRFDEGMSFELPYEDESYDRVISSLFFHHLTRIDKLRTLNEVRRMLKPDGELHIADWGRPQNFLMRIVSGGITLLDGAETTNDNFKGRLASLVIESGFHDVDETSHFNTLFGTIRLLRARRADG